MENELYHWGVKGMKWGVRRYQNKDGSLTNAGQKRYDRDKLANAGKKKGDKIGAADPDRWVTEDMTRTRRLADESSQMTSRLKNTVDTINRNQPKPKVDLSSMTDKQMRDEINRALLERQYRDLCTPQNTSRGRETVSRTLEMAGNVLGVASSALGVALAIRTLTKGG